MYSSDVTRKPQSNLELIKRVLGDEYLELNLKHLSIEEESEESSSVVVEIVDAHGATHTVQGKGSGLVAAVFAALLNRYAPEYQSLKSIELADFRIEGQMDTKQDRNGVDAMARLTIDVRNSEGTIFSFSDQARSIVTASARATLAIGEYFINAERAFIALYRSRQDAQERSRSDLVARYTREMAEVVKSTSYAAVIENIKKELS